MPCQESIAKFIDHSLLSPTLTDKQLIYGCELADRLGVASVCIKPYAVDLAYACLRGSSVAVGTVIGFPHGNSTIKVKVDEARVACLDGANEIDMVVNIGKVIASDWDYVTDELEAVIEQVHALDGIVKVIFENDYLPCDAAKLKLCAICKSVKADYVKTSTGYGFVKGFDERYVTRGATVHDVKLMADACLPAVKVKAAGGIRNLQDALRLIELGATRIGTSATEKIVKESNERLLRDDTHPPMTENQ